MTSFAFGKIVLVILCIVFVRCRLHFVQCSDLLRPMAMAMWFKLTRLQQMWPIQFMSIQSIVSLTPTAFYSLVEYQNQFRTFIRKLSLRRSELFTLSNNFEGMPFCSFYSIGWAELCEVFAWIFIMASEEKFLVTKKNVISSATNSGLKRMLWTNFLAQNAGVLFIRYIKSFALQLMRWFFVSCLLFFFSFSLMLWAWNNEWKKSSCNTLAVFMHS